MTRNDGKLQAGDLVDAGKAAGKGAATGSAIGGAVGSVVPGVGTAIGGAVGGVVGGVAGAVGALWDDGLSDWFDRHDRKKNKNDPAPVELYQGAPPRITQAGAVALVLDVARRGGPPAPEWLALASKAPPVAAFEQLAAAIKARGGPPTIDPDARGLLVAYLSSAKKV